MIRRRLGNLSRCPAPCRAFACGALLGALAACHLTPRPVAGVPFAEPWLALPLRSWLAEDRAEPEAIALCRPPVCAPGLVVGVVRLAGREADLAEAGLREPARTVRSLSAGRDAKVPTTASARPLRAGAAHGFAIALRRADGSRPVHGAVLGQRSGPDLRLVVVVGEDADTVEGTVGRVAREHLGSDGVVRLPFTR